MPEQLDVEQLVADLASPLFRYRMARGLKAGFEQRPESIEENTPAYASACTRLERAEAAIVNVVHRYARQAAEAEAYDSQRELDRRLRAMEPPVHG